MHKPSMQCDSSFKEVSLKMYHVSHVLRQLGCKIHVNVKWCKVSGDHTRGASQLYQDMLCSTTAMCDPHCDTVSCSWLCLAERSTLPYSQRHISVKSHCVGHDTSVGIVTDYRLDGPGSNLSKAETIHTVQTGSGAHPAFCTVGTGSFPGVKWPGRGIDHPPRPSAEVKERVKLYLYSPFGPFWLLIGWPLPLLCLCLTQQTEGLLNEFVC